MNPTLYDLLLVALSALLSWFITHRYYKKSLDNQAMENEKERNALMEALQQPNKAESALLTQQYIDGAVNEWKKKGTPVNYIDSLEKSQEEKATIFRSASIRNKGREPKRNPYEAE